MDIPSKKLNEAVDALAGLPGVGKRTALRYAFYLLRMNRSALEEFAHNIASIKDLKKCKNCFNLTEAETCEICSNPNRDRSVVCVVENVRDLYAIENTRQFKGLYHVLEGLISPMEGIGPADINISSLLDRINEQTPTEIILALSSTVEAETTNFYIYKKLKDKSLTVSNLARGISFGDELEYTDEISLVRSLTNRTIYHSEIK